MKKFLFYSLTSLLFFLFIGTSFSQYSVPNLDPRVTWLESNKLNRVGPDTFVGKLTILGDLEVSGTEIVSNLYVTNYLGSIYDKNYSCIGFWLNHY